MTGRELPYTVGLAVVALIALGAGVMTAMGHNDGRLMLSLMSLAIVGLAMIVLAWIWGAKDISREERVRLLGDLRADLVGFDKRLSEESQRHDELSEMIEELRESQTESHATITASMETMKQSYGEIVTQVKQVADFVATAVQESQAAAQQAQAYQQHYSALYASPVEMAQHYEPANDVNSAMAQEPVYQEAQSAEYAQHVHHEPTHLHHEEPQRYQADEHEMQEQILPSVVVPPQPAPAVAEQLLTSLEPVIDLFTNKTAHYRLLLSMLKPDQTEVPTDTLLHHADRTGLRQQFDLHATREALGLLRHLRQRDSQLAIFMPLGPASIQSAETLAGLLRVRAEFEDVASGLVYEFSHASLAGLSERGLEGLATLARRGVVMAMTNAAVSGVDAPSLARLNVRYLSLAGNTILANNGPAPQLLAFSQLIRANRIQLIATNVLSSAEAQRLSKAVRYASGPGFAAPRRVKAGVASEAPNDVTQAA